MVGGGRRSPPRPILRDFSGGRSKGLSYSGIGNVSAQTAAFEASIGAANAGRNGRTTSDANRFSVLGQISLESDNEVQATGMDEAKDNQQRLLQDTSPTGVQDKSVPRDAPSSPNFDTQLIFVDKFHPGKEAPNFQIKVTDGPFGFGGLQQFRMESNITSKGIQGTPLPGAVSTVEQPKPVFSKQQTADPQLGQGQEDRSTPPVNADQPCRVNSDALQVTYAPSSDAMMNDSDGKNCNLQFFGKRGDTAMIDSAISLDCTQTVCGNAETWVALRKSVENAEVHNPMETNNEEVQPAHVLEQNFCPNDDIEMRPAPIPAASAANGCGSTPLRSVQPSLSNDSSNLEASPFSMPHIASGSFNLGQAENQQFMDTNSGAASAWKKPEHIKVCWNIPDFKKDGAVTLNSNAVEDNQRKLERALVGKLMGRKMPFSVLLAELKKRWSHVGTFHLIMVSEDCFTCIFESLEARDTILHGGPWIIAGYIIGLDKWTPNFSVKSLSGFTTPIWIRLPQLPLLYWDNDNIARMASWVGTPLLIDAFTSSWGHSSYARACVQVDLSQSLPKGVWINGIHGKFFQPIEYEGVNLICFSCGKVGHKEGSCPMQPSKAAQSKLTNGTTIMGDGVQPPSDPSSSCNPPATANDPGEWILVTQKKNRAKRDKKQSNFWRELRKETTYARNDKQPPTDDTSKPSPSFSLEPAIGTEQERSSSSTFLPPSPRSTNPSC